MPREFIGISGLSSGRLNCLHFLAAAPLFAAAMCICSLAEAQENPQKPQQTIRIGVERVNVGVIVSDHSGHFVAGLRREDFRVFDNGIEQSISGFSAIEEPGQVLLLIEAGPAVYLLEGGHVWAANELLDGLSADDRVAVVKYTDSAATLLDFTADKRAVDTAFGQLRFNLGFGSLNLASSVSEVLEWLAGVQGKKTIVLLSTGVDTSRSNEAALLMQKLRVSDVRLLAVSLAGSLQNHQPGGKKKLSTKDSGETAQQFEQAGELLKQMAASTGGRAYFPANAKDFNSAYAEIAMIIRHEYSLSFSPSIRDGLTHAIKVSVNAPPPNRQDTGYRVDHRQGYVAPLPKNEPAIIPPNN
jgi:Ca-activated chloride channel family protein